MIRSLACALIAMLSCAPAAAAPKPQAPGPQPKILTGDYWAGPEEHRIIVNGRSYFAAGAAAQELDALLARHTPKGRAYRATVTACAMLSGPGRYGYLGKHDHSLGLVKLLRVVTPRGRVLLNRPARC